MTRKKIAIVEDDRLLRQQIALSLTKDYSVLEAGDRVDAEKLLEQETPDLVLLDLNLPPSGTSREGMSLIEKVKSRYAETMVIVMSGNDQRAIALKAVEAGAYDFFRKPFDLAELKLIIGRALEKQQIERENSRLRQELRARYCFENIIGQTPAMKQVFEAVRRVANSATSVIVRGESGTGKELIARAIHYNSSRHKQPFISVNCAALPETLVESELFGHERGAFTGAIAAHPGRFELANNGTLFLDEIGAISPAVQAKLLRVLEDRKIERVGGTRALHTDVRLITATNEDLERQVSEGKFREDLYYRIHVFPINVPPLRERKEDIPLLLHHFLTVYCAENRVPVKTVEPAALEMLTGYRWKGNVRELENLVQTLVLMADSPTITASLLPSYISGVAAAASGLSVPDEGIDLEQATECYQRALMEAALQKVGGVRIKAAKLLGIDANRMKYLCRKFKIKDRKQQSAD